MSRDINTAFKQKALRAEYKGMQVMVLPIDAALAKNLDQTKIKQDVTAGQMLLSWNENNKRNGSVVNADAHTDIVFLVKRNDNTNLRVPATSMTEAVIDLLDAKAASVENAISIAEANAKAQSDYAEAVERGDTVAQPIDQTPEFSEDAFARIDTLISCVKHSQLAIKADKFSDIAAKADADGFTAKLRNATRSDLTRAQISMVNEARNLRGEIALLNPDHPGAAEAVMPAAYEGDGEAARTLMAEMPDDPQGLSAVQDSAMSANGDLNLAIRLFSVATTTPAMAVEKTALSHTGFSTFAQELAKFENKDADHKILPRMLTVTSDAMEGYNWQGKIYTKDGADILLMRDEYAAFAYAWDSESRIGDLNLSVLGLEDPSVEDVPTEQELEELRAIVVGMRYDNGAEVNFEWDDEPTDDLLEDPEENEMAPAGA